MILLKPQNLRKRCLVCNLNKPDSDEHVFPLWMQKITNTVNKKIRWITDEKITGSSCIFPICTSCNKELNEGIEKPFQVIFEKLKKGKKISDTEVEIMVRWMWKVTQMFWLYGQNKGYYYWHYSLKDRCLKPIDGPRNRISIAIAKTIKNIKTNNMEPMGLDVLADYDSVLAAGVFSTISIIVFRTDYSYLIPDKYFVYTLQQSPKTKIKDGYAIAKKSFTDSGEAIYVTTKTAQKLLPLHERDAALTWKVLQNIPV